MQARAQLDLSAENALFLPHGGGGFGRVIFRGETTGRKEGCISGVVMVSGRDAFMGFRSA